MRPSRRLDVIVVPEDPDLDPIGPLRELYEDLLAREVITAEGAPGPAAARWMVGGFERLYLDDPGEMTLWANRQGGFAALCPTTSEVITAAFSTALTEARRGGAWALTCPSCGSRHALHEVRGRPAFAFASAALVTADAQAARLTEEGSMWTRRRLGSARVILRRA